MEVVKLGKPRRILRNRSGQVEFAELMGISVILVGIVMGSFFFRWGKELKEEQGFRKAMVGIDEYLDEVIINVEEEGYITKEMIYNITRYGNQFNMKSLDFKISGTTDKVDTGEDVYIEVDVATKEMR